LGAKRLSETNEANYSIEARKKRKALIAAVFVCTLMVVSNFAVLMTALNPGTEASSAESASPAQSVPVASGHNALSNAASHLQPKVKMPQSGSDLNIAGSALIKDIVAKIGDLRVSGDLSILDSIIELRNLYVANNSNLFVDPTTLIVNGNIWVDAGATVTFDNTLVRMNCTTDGQYRIQVNATGRLILKNLSEVTNGTTDHNYLFIVNGRLDVWNSNVSRVGMPMDAPYLSGKGLYIGSTGVAEFNYSRIYDNKVGVIADNGAKVTIKNSTIENNAIGVLAYQDSNAIVIEHSSIQDNGQTDSVQLPVKVSNIFSDDFESGTGQWTMNSQTLPPTYFNDVESGAGGYMVAVYQGGSLWHTTSLWSNSSSNSWWAGQELTSDYNYGPGQRSATALISPVIDTTGLQNPHFRFYEAFQTEGLRLGNTTVYDQCHVNISSDNGLTWTEVRWSNPTGGNNPSWPFFDMADIDISAFSSNQVRFMFWFDTMDGLNNTFWGWFVDDFRIYDANTRQWALTVAQSQSAVNSLTDSPGTNYAKGENVTAQTINYVDLSDPSISAAYLQFYSLYRTQAGADFFLVEASNDYGVSWVELANHSGSSPGWPATFQGEQIDLTSYLGSNHMLLRLRMTANMDNTIFDGVYVDDVIVTVTRSLPVSGGIVAYMSNNVVVDGNLIAGNGDPTGTFTFVRIPQVTPLFIDDVEGGPFWWTTIPMVGPDLWHITNTASSSPVSSWWCGQEITGDYATGGRIFDLLSSPIIDITGIPPGGKIMFDERYWTEASNFYDRCYFEVTTDGGFSWTPIYYSHPLAGSMNPNRNPEWPGFRTVVLDLAPYISTTFGMRFAFDTIDGIINNYPGWFLDNIGFGVDTSTPAHVFGGVLSLDYSSVKLIDNDVVNNFGYGVYANTTSTAEWTVINGGSAVSNDINLNGNVTVRSGQLTFDDVHGVVWNVTISQPGSMQLVNSPTTVISSDVLNYGSLYVNSSTWLMNCSYDGEFAIDNYGYMYVDSSTIDRFVASNYLFRTWSNGSIQMFGSAVHHCGYSSAALEDCGFFIATDNADIGGCDFSTNYYGMVVVSSAPSIVSTSVSSNSVFGLYWLNATPNAVLSSVNINSNGWTGLLVSGNDVTLDISGSNVNGNGFDGIDVIAGSTSNVNIATSNINSNTNHGAFVSTAATTSLSISSATVNGNGMSGVYVSTANLIANLQSLTANSNGANGVHLSASWDIDLTTFGCVFLLDGGYGILASSGNSTVLDMLGDVAIADTSGGISINAVADITGVVDSETCGLTAGNGLSLTSSSGNVMADIHSSVGALSANGIVVQAALDVGGTIDGNMAYSNAATGILVTGGTVSGDVTWNVAYDNNLDGILISSTTGDISVDATGNVVGRQGANPANRANGLRVSSARDATVYMSGVTALNNSNCGILVEATNNVSITILGTTANFNGIAGADMDGVLVRGNSIVYTDIEGLTASGNFDNGLQMSALVDILQPSLIGLGTCNGNANQGIRLEANNDLYMSIILQTCSFNVGNGIAIFSGADQSVTLESCTAFQNGDSGIYMDGATIATDLISNVASNNTGSGIYLQGGTMIDVYSEGNTCSNNTASGIALVSMVDAFVVMIGDQADTNVDFGIIVSAGNNVLDGSTIDSFATRGNGDSGVLVTATWAVENLSILNGNASSNGATGISVSTANDYIIASVTDNIAESNPTGIWISTTSGADVDATVTSNDADNCMDAGIMVSSSNGDTYGNISHNEANGILSPAGYGIAIIAPNGEIHTSVYANNATYSAWVGIWVQASNGWIYSDIRNNDASNATMAGIVATGFDCEATIVGNTANGCGMAGIISQAMYTSVVVDDNFASDCMVIGIAVIGNYGVYADVSGNTADNCLGFGIYIQNDQQFYTNVLTISDNHASYNSFNLFGPSAGIMIDFSVAGGNNYLTADFSGNEVRNNTIGIQILNQGIGTSDVTFSGDTAVNNTMDGISILTYDGQISMFLCTASSNGMNGVSVNAANLLMCTLDSSTFDLNGANGAVIEGTWSITGTVIQNSFQDNAQNGLRMFSALGSILSTIELNTADGNLMNGMEVVAGNDITASFLGNVLTNNVWDGVYMNAADVLSFIMDGDVADYNGLDGINANAGSSMVGDMNAIEAYENDDKGLSMVAPAIDASISADAGISYIGWNDESIYISAQNSLVVDISDTSVYANNYGAQLLCSAGDITATVADSGFYYNGDYGLYTWQSSGDTYATFTNNDAYNNFGDGFRMSSTGMVNASFDSNAIRYNTQNGVTIGCGDLDTGQFINNDIYSNGNNGINVNTVYGTLVLSGNSVYGNCDSGGFAGVYLSGFQVTLRADAMSNWITGNYGDGILVSAVAQADIYMRASNGNYLSNNEENGLNASTSSGWVDLYATNLYCDNNGINGVLLGGPYDYVEVSDSDFSGNGNGFVMMPSNWCYGVIEDSGVYNNWDEVGIYAQYADGLAIRDCVVKYNPIGIDIESSWLVEIYDNEVSENLDTGVLLDDVGDAQMWDNVIDDNLAYGIYVEAVTNALIFNNNVDRNLDTGIYVESGCTVQLINNWVTYNYGWGVYCEVGSSVNWLADISTDNNYAYVKMNPVLLTGNVTVYDLSTFWLDDSTLWFNNVRVMQYWVQVYSDGLLNMDDAMISSWNDYTYGFYVWGTLDMDFGIIDQAYEVQVMSGGLVNALYSTIQHGFVHGIRAEPGSTVLCVETEFHENAHSGIFADGATVDVSECLFDNNGREGIFATDCDLTVSWSVFEDNDRGIRLDACSDVTVDSCRFLDNVVGLESLNASSVDVLRSWFQDNGIGTLAGGSSVEYFENCTMTGDYVLDIRSMGGSAVIILNTPTDRLFDIRDSSSLVVEWYLDVMVMDELMVPIQGALVTVTDGNGVPIISGVPTDSLGYVKWVIVTEEIVYFAWTDLSMQPYVIDAADGLSSDSETILIDDTMTVYLVINHPPEYIGGLSDVSFDEEDALYDEFNLNSCFDDRDDITFSVSGNSMIVVTINPNGSVDFASPTVDWAGSEMVTFRATDMYGAFAEHTIMVTVNNVNDPPMITSTPVTTGTQGVTYYYLVTADDADIVYGDYLTFSLDVAPAGMSIDSVTGLIDWIPASDQIGLNWVVVHVEDSTGEFVTQMFSITVANVNDAPSITSSPVTTATQDAAYEYDVTAGDADLPYGDFLTFSLTTAPAGMAIDSATGVITWTPAWGQIGLNAVVVKVTDSLGLSATQSFSVDVANVNDPPMITSTPVTTGKEGSAYYYLVTASDKDTAYGDTLTFSLVSAPTGMAIDGVTGEITWTPASNQVGVQMVTVRVTDSGSATATQTYSIMVENTPNAPMIDPITPKVAAVGSLFTFDVNATDADTPYGDVLTFSLTTAPAGMAIDSATGVIQWVPDIHSAPTLLVTVKVTDSTGLIDAETFAITVTGLNHAPSISSVSITPANPVRNSTLTAAPAGWSDADGDSASYVYQWYVNGVPIVGGNALNISGVFAKGDIVACQVTPYDGKEYGTPVMSVGVVIGNTAPTMAGVSISPVKPKASSTLIAMPQGYADVDGDAGSYLFQWEKFNVTSGAWEPIVGATSANLSGAFAQGDLVRCVATPFDGADAGDSVTSEQVTVAADPAEPFPVAILATIFGILFAALFFVVLILWMMGRIKKKAAGAAEPESPTAESQANTRRLKTPPQT
jgi:parallel beta-helix repeat protein